MARARLLALLLPVLAAVSWPGTATAAGHLVRITSTLEPGRLTIAPGDTVTWRNDDDERHRVRSRSGPVEFDSGDLEPGESFRVRLSAAGTYPFIDERDDDAQRYWGTIVVADPASPDPGEGGDGGAGGEGGAEDRGGASSAATIGMAGRAFGPASVTIAAGGTVTWRNDDDREHTATSKEGAFDSGVLAEGASFRETFPTTGTFPFLCGIHPEMTGTVTVVAAGTGAGGSDGTGSATPAPAATPVTTPGPEPSARATSTALPDATAPPGVQAGAAGGTSTAGADGEPIVTTLVSTVLALGLIVGALMVATGVLLGLARRGEGPAGAAS